MVKEAEEWGEGGREGGRERRRVKGCVRKVVSKGWQSQLIKCKTTAQGLQALSIGYIPRCRMLRDLHNRGPKALRLCKSRSVHRGI